MHVVVAIVGYRNAGDIARCLDHLQRSTHRTFEIVVCENGGRESFERLRAALPSRLAGGQRVELIEAGSNLGYAGGVNTCLAARPDAAAWWVLNPDTLPHEGALAALVARLERGDCEAVGGVLHNEAGVVQTLGGRWRPWLARAESIGLGLRLDALPPPSEVEARLDFLSGASMLVSQAFVRRAGLMRDDYFLYAEEVEWFVRGKALGLRLGYTPDARVVHHEGSTTGSANAESARPRLPVYLDERNKLHVVRDTAPLRLPVALLTAPVVSALRFARRGAWRQWRWALQGWAAALRNERGPAPWLAR